MNKPKILIFSLSATLFLTASCLVYSWSEPATSMPSGYTAPLNTSSTAQTKTGALTVPMIYDQNDTSYYVDPSGLTKLSKTYFTGGSGDVTNDGLVDSWDALIILDYLAGKIKLGDASFTPEIRAEADVNGDGNIDVLDAELILNMDVGNYATLQEAQLAGKQISDRAIDIDESGYVRIKYLGGGSGDINGDEKSDTRDVMYIAQYLNGLREFTDEQKYEADINGDNDVDMLDAVMILKLNVGYSLKEARSHAKTIKDRAIDIDGDGNVSFSGSIGDILTKNIQVDGDICFSGTGKCLSDLLNRLVFSNHSENDCRNVGGTVVYETDSTMGFCKVFSSTCPSGWTQYKNWSTTTPASPCSCTCTGRGCCYGTFTATWGANINGWGDCGGHTPVCSSHSWSNTPVESTLLGVRTGNCACYDCCQCSVSATVTQIGCY